MSGYLASFVYRKWDVVLIELQMPDISRTANSGESMVQRSRETTQETGDKTKESLSYGTK